MRAVWVPLGFRLKVGNVDRSTLEHTLVANRASVERSAHHAAGWYRTEMGYRDHLVTLNHSNHRVIGSAHLSSPLGNRIEHRLDLGRRTRDDLKNLARRCLLLQRFLELLKQPGILDRDNRLIGKGFEQLDLRVRERANFQAANQNRPDR